MISRFTAPSSHRDGMSVFTALTSMTLSALLLARLLLARPPLLMRTPGNIFPTRTPTCIYVAAVPSYFSTTPRRPPSTPSGDTAPLWLLMLSSVTNIFLDLLFVIRFGMGVPGVA
ncbi:MAG: hypothetical protein ACLVL7_12390 [Anaerotruncus massiliensis (ex Togo et al. 2019)]